MQEVSNHAHGLSELVSSPSQPTGPRSAIMSTDSIGWCQHRDKQPRNGGQDWKVGVKRVIQHSVMSTLPGRSKLVLAASDCSAQCWGG